MSSPDPKESTGPDHGSSTTSTQTIVKRPLGTLSIFTTGALRSVHQCGTCQRPISLSCARLKHVAHCKAIDDSGKACNIMYSTMYGCFKHPYRDGHNPKMKEHSAIVKAGLGGSASSPALASLGRLVTVTKSPLSKQTNASAPLASTSKPQPHVPLSAPSSSVRSQQPAPSAPAKPAQTSTK